MDNAKIGDILARMKALERDLEAELAHSREGFRYRLEGHRIRFEQGVRAQHRKLKQSLVGYVLFARPLHVLTAPVVYAVALPLVLLDLFVTLYQWVCFPVYRIPRVRRRDYLAFDRHQLGYLNLIEKFNCYYCAYGNGLIAYCREVFARTEQYWCPIKHARRMLDRHSRYIKFVEYGDGEGYRRELKKLRADFGTDETPLNK